MSSFEALLQVQERDTSVDQLRRRRATLPERTRLSELEQRVALVEARLGDVRSNRESVAERQARLEEEVRLLDGRVEEIERRLYSGTVSASRELQALSAEVASVKRHRSSVEDSVLEAMEEGEPLDREAQSLEAERDQLDAESERLRAALVEEEVAIDAEVAADEAERAGAAAGVPDELLRTYEGLRAKLGGVGAARLVGASCSGCHLVLPSAEVARLKRQPPDALVFCEQCGRILVR